jgi:hypothetical protein
LPKAAAEIEKGGAVLETLYDGGVGGRAGEAEIGEAQLANAGIGVDFPSPIALWGLSARRMDGRKGRTHDFQNVWNDTLRCDVAVVFKKVSLDHWNIFQIRCVPSYSLVSGPKP